MISCVVVPRTVLVARPLLLNRTIIWPPTESHAASQSGSLLSLNNRAATQSGSPTSLNNRRPSICSLPLLVGSSIACGSSPLAAEL